MKIILTNISSRMSSIAILIISGGLSLWTSAQAQFNTGPVAQPPPTTNLTFTTISGFLCTLINWLFTLLVLATIVFVILAGYKYLTAGGDEEKIKSANHQLIYAAIALVVGLVSKGIPILINQFVGSSGGLPSC